MKTRIFKIIVLLLAICNLNTSYAQAPKKMSYQAVIRNASNVLVSNTLVRMRITIKGSSPSSSSYSETQTVTTNANGLATFQIGNGTILSGTMAGINWANGPYSIITETDPTGGTNYTITGTSELLSVPYALFSANGTPRATGPQGPIGLTGATGVVGPPGPTGIPGAIGPQGSIGLTGATGGYPVHFIGESYGGGIVFYVYDNGEHGLIAATADQSAGIQWFNNTFRITGTSGDGLGAGAMNTAMIVSTQMADNQIGNFAAKVCADYSVLVNGVFYGDWYLPSKHELNLLYLQKNVVGGFLNDYYWSSSEILNTSVWYQNFLGGNPSLASKNGFFYTRAIRAF